MDEGLVQAQLQELTRQMENDRDEVVEHPDEEIILETPGEAAEEEFDADAAVGNRRRHHWVWCSLQPCCAGAGVDAAASQPAETGGAPWFQRPVQSFYALFGVIVEPRWDIRAYDVRQFSGDVLVGPTTASWCRHCPQQRRHCPATTVIRVELLDRYQNTLSTTYIAPSEYLLNAAPDRMAPDQRFDTTLTILDPTRQAAGFQLDTCLPTPGGNHQCSHDP